MKVKFGSLVVDGRGKIGGHVLSKNRGGAYMRTKVTPINPQTADQSAVRGTLTSLSQSWRALTISQIKAWNNAVQNFQSTDIFGDIKKPSGINLYVKLNSNLAFAEVGTVLSDPPALTTAPVFVDFSATAAAGTPALSIVFSPTPVGADTTYVVEATAPQSPGKSFLKNQYRKIKIIPAAGATPNNALAAYVAKFGALVAGEKIGLRIKAVDNLTGVSGQYNAIEIIIAA